jgi:hypothetical protein
MVPGCKFWRSNYVAVQLAAYDKRISDQTWRGLDPGRKEPLLPLVEDRRLREAAQHRSARLTAPVLLGRVKKIHETLGGAAVVRRVRALHGDLEASERHALVGEIDKAREALSAIARELRGR